MYAGTHTWMIYIRLLQCQLQAAVGSLDFARTSEGEEVVVQSRVGVSAQVALKHSVGLRCYSQSIA